MVAAMREQLQRARVEDAARTDELRQLRSAVNHQAPPLPGPCWAAPCCVPLLQLTLVAGNLAGVLCLLVLLGLYFFATGCRERELDCDISAYELTPGATDRAVLLVAGLLGLTFATGLLSGCAGWKAWGVGRGGTLHSSVPRCTLRAHTVLLGLCTVLELLVLVRTWRPGPSRLRLAGSVQMPTRTLPLRCCFSPVCLPCLPNLSTIPSFLVVYVRELVGAPLCLCDCACLA